VTLAALARRRRAIAAALALGVPGAAHAGDTQLWATALAQGPIVAGAGAKPMVWLEVQPRFGEDVSHLNNLIVRPGFGIWLAPDFNVLAGYHLQRNTPAGGTATTEHRMWQQLLVPIVRDPARIILLARLRLEQRSLDNGQDLGWRLRTMLRLQLPLHGRGSAGPLFWSEALTGLNDTDWGQQGGLRQVRSFAGVLVPIDKRLNFEGGYMAQYERLSGGDRVNHVANLTLNYRLGD
jgi:hypothetical protein